MAPFFEGVDKKPLTPEQRLAVVCDEDATLVLAGAGSGKTSVIAAKAAYLIERRIRKPEEILLLAFGREAAKEISGRVKQCCGVSVTATTFHALAYRIIAEVEGTAPPLAAHASDDAAYNALLREILFEQVANDAGTVLLLLRWFHEFFVPIRNSWDFETKHDYFRYIESHELRTLRGEKVRSFEELEIANWLYMNGIAYEYEPIYEYKLPDASRKAYTPDFRLKESGVYIEHFGVRRELDATGNERLTTAPFIDREQYLAGMEWKRQVHAAHGTTLIETFSYEKSEGRLTFGLREKLSPYVELKPLPPESVFDRLSKMGQVDAFTHTLATFLRHFKGTGLTLEQCRRKGKGGPDRRRSLAFLDIFESVFTAYQERLGGRIDFEDMITRATGHIRANRYQSPYRHLLVDEFQDISQGRADLLRALKEQHVHARIFAVGDDWQSIYRFSGADIHLMRDFGRIFGGTFAGKTGIHRSVDLGRTFRSVDRLALPARSFVLENPSQIMKNVAPAAIGTEPAIWIVWSAKRRGGGALKQALTHLAKQMKGARASVLLLGRYNRQCPDRLTGLSKLYPDLSLSFKSIHAAKGLEADHVIILGADGGRLGLPSEIVDDPVLNLVLPEPELFEHAEERRVFYVALTRARKSVTIIAFESQPSRFVTELLEREEYGATALGKTRHRRYRCDRCGGRLLLGSKNRFVCEHRDLCDANLPTCAACGLGLPLRDASEPVVRRCTCGAIFPACPECVDGWLVERIGKYGHFLGCVNYPQCAGRKAAT